MGYTNHPSQPPHHLLHPLLPDVGVNLGGADALMAQQGLDVHQFRPGVEQVGGVGVAQFVRADLLVDPGLLQHPPQVGPGRLRRHRFLPRRAGEHELAPGAILQPEPKHRAKGLWEGHQALLVALPYHPHRPGRAVHQAPGCSVPVRDSFSTRSGPLLDHSPYRAMNGGSPAPPSREVPPSPLIENQAAPSGGQG